jgi:hypothetical protein
MQLVIGVYIGSGFMALTWILRLTTIDGAYPARGDDDDRGEERGLWKGMMGVGLGPVSQKALGR